MSVVFGLLSRSALLSLNAGYFWMIKAIKCKKKVMIHPVLRPKDMKIPRKIITLAQNWT